MAHKTGKRFCTTQAFVHESLVVNNVRAERTQSPVSVDVAPIKTFAVAYSKGVQITVHDIVPNCNSAMDAEILNKSNPSRAYPEKTERAMDLRFWPFCDRYHPAAF